MASPDPELAPVDPIPSDPPASLPGPSGLDSTDDDVFNITVAQDDDDLVELEQHRLLIRAPLFLCQLSNLRALL